MYALAFATLSSDAGLSAAGMYVPFVRTGFAGEADRLLYGPWLFLQFDLIIITIASLSWVYLLLVDMMDTPRISRGMLMLALLTCSVVVGAGATVSMALFWREGLLEQLRKQTEITGGENQLRKQTEVTGGENQLRKQTEVTGGENQKDARAKLVASLYHQA